METKPRRGHLLQCPSLLGEVVGPGGGGRGSLRFGTATRDWAAAVRLRVRMGR